MKWPNRVVSRHLSVLSDIGEARFGGGRRPVPCRAVKHLHRAGAIQNAGTKHRNPVWRGVAGHLWAVILQGSAPARRVRALITGRGPDLQGGPASLAGSPAGFAGGPAGFVSSSQKIPGSRVWKAGSRGRRVGSRAVFYVFRVGDWFSEGKAAMPVSGPPSPRPHCR